jgi:hypothetical protein
MLFVVFVHSSKRSCLKSPCLYEILLQTYYDKISNFLSVEQSSLTLHIDVYVFHMTSVLNIVCMHSVAFIFYFIQYISPTMQLIILHLPITTCFGCTRTSTHVYFPLKLLQYICYVKIFVSSDNVIQFNLK